MLLIVYVERSYDLFNKFIADANFSGNILKFRILNIILLICDKC